MHGVNPAAFCKEGLISSRVSQSDLTEFRAGFRYPLSTVSVAMHGAEVRADSGIACLGLAQASPQHFLPPRSRLDL